jgi:hypothetical protein
MRWLPLVMAAALWGGCKQGVNERCQVQSDCDDGLICVLPAGGTPQSGGTCQPNGGSTVDMTTPGEDMAMPGDMAMQPPVDMVEPPDMLQVD